MKSFVGALLASIVAITSFIGCSKESKNFSLLNVPEDGLFLSTTQDGFQVEFTGTAEWSSQNTSVVQVSGDGYISVIATGSTTVTATSGGGTETSFIVRVAGQNVNSYKVPSSVNVVPDCSVSMEVTDISPSTSSAKDLTVSLSSTQNFYISRRKDQPNTIIVTAYPYTPYGTTAKLKFTNTTGTVIKECNICVPELTALDIKFANSIPYVIKGGNAKAFTVYPKPSKLYPIECSSESDCITVSQLLGDNYEIVANSGSQWANYTVKSGNLSVTKEIFAVDPNNIGLFASKTTGGKSSRTGCLSTQSINGQTINVSLNEVYEFYFSMDAEGWRDCMVYGDVPKSALDLSLYGVKEISDTWINTKNANNSIEFSCTSAFDGKFRVRAIKTGLCEFKYKSKGMTQTQSFTLNCK